jgi:putative peptidoglycan lipid II flippase
MLTRAFYSLQESGIPARSAVLAVAINLVLNLTLVWPLGTGGLAAATATCSYVQVVILTILLQRRLGGAVLTGLGRALRDTAVATLCMAAAVWGVRRLFEGPDSLLLLLTAVAAGATAYLVAARVLRVEMLSLLWGGRTRRGAEDSR